MISLWDDTRIKPGSKWRDEISEALDRAKAAILLVSADFLASPFIKDNELPPLLSAAETRGTLILTVILSPCRFLQTATLSCFQAVNSPDEPLVQMRRAKREATFVRLSSRVEQAFASSQPQSPVGVDAHQESIAEQDKRKGLTREEPITRNTLRFWSDDDLMRYVADRIAAQNLPLAPGVVVTLSDLFREAADSAVRTRLYELVHGCQQNGWLAWSGADQDRQVRLTVTGTERAAELTSHSQPKEQTQDHGQRRVTAPKQILDEVAAAEDWVFRSLEAELREPVQRKVRLNNGQGAIEVDGLVPREHGLLAVRVKLLRNGTSLRELSLIGARAIALAVSIDQVRDNVPMWLLLALVGANLDETTLERLRFSMKDIHKSTSGVPIEVKLFELPDLREQLGLPPKRE